MAATLKRIRFAFDNLTPAQEGELLRFAQHWATRFRTGEDPEDIVQKAKLRVLDGKRQWNRTISFPQFLKGVIRSLASEKLPLPPTNPER
jgi:hypothetical protein